MYRANAITKRVGGRTLIEDISLSCEPGQALAIIGPNGAGKTVLLKAMALVDPPSDGRIEIDGVNFSFPEASHPNPSPPWPELTFVFQQLFLWPHLTLLANISLAAELRSNDPRSTRRRARDLAAQLGIENELSRYPNQVSGGQRQRAAIARALMLRPKWLLLDEPNSAQDVEQVDLLSRLILNAKREGVGIIFSTHLLGLAGSVADRIAFLDQGRLVESGTKEILSRPSTDRLRRFMSIVEYTR